MPDVAQMPDGRPGGGKAVGPRDSPTAHVAWSGARLWNACEFDELDDLTKAAAQLRYEWGSNTNTMRAKRMKWLVQMAKECKPQQVGWESSLETEIYLVARHKRVPAMRHILGALGYDDMDGLAIWETGLSTIGRQAASDLFEALPPILSNHFSRRYGPWVSDSTCVAYRY